jgi:hypothetical protein
MLEKCPHCDSDVLFVTDICPSCQADRKALVDAAAKAKRKEQREAAASGGQARPPRLVTISYGLSIYTIVVGLCFATIEWFVAPNFTEVKQMPLVQQVHEYSRYRDFNTWRGILQLLPSLGGLVITIGGIASLRSSKAAVPDGVRSVWSRRAWTTLGLFAISLAVLFYANTTLVGMLK